ncbi:hypothetical protein PAMP_013531 [Pampus punctatissimus]
MFPGTHFLEGLLANGFWVIGGSGGHHVRMIAEAPEVPHQMGALTFYRYEQPIVDYCQAHQPLRLNMGYEGPPQGLESLEDLGPCDRGTIQTVALPAVPSAASMGAPVPGPRSPPPPLRPPTEGPSSGPFLPAERTGTLKFGR